jgi:hypothetical protein
VAAATIKVSNADVLLTLLHALHSFSSQAKAKVTDAITSIDGEHCYNVGVCAQLNNKEAETMAW